MLSYAKETMLQKRKKQSFSGNMYNTHQQLLTQMITHYPKSILIDDFYLDNLVTHSVKHKQSQGKVIKFVGEQQQNIRQIMAGLDSLDACQNRIMMQKQRCLVQAQFSQILAIFYGKIHKIRKQRDFYKNSYEIQKNTSHNKVASLCKQTNQLKEQISCLKKEKQCLMQKLQIQSKKRQYFERECSMLQQRHQFTNLNCNQDFEDVNRSIQDLLMIDKTNDKINYEAENVNSDGSNESQDRTRLMFKGPNKKCNILSESQNQLQTQSQRRNGKYSDQKAQVQAILKRHNLQPSQLGQIIQEYLKQLRQNHQIKFQNEEQKRLYFIAKKMQTKIWNKKVKKDIEKLISVKDSIAISQSGKKVYRNKG